MLIGITGKKRSGKDQFALFLANHLRKVTGKTVVIDKYATDLKLSLLHGMHQVQDSNKPQYTIDDIDGIGVVNRELPAFITEIASLICYHAANYLGVNASYEVIYQQLKECKIKYNSSTERFSIRELMQYFGTDVIRDGCYDGFWVSRVEQRYIRSTDTITIVTDCRFDNEIALINKYNGKLFQIIRPNNAAAGDSHVSENGINDYGNAVIIQNDGDLTALNQRAKFATEELHNVK